MGKTKAADPLQMFGENLRRLRLSKKLGLRGLSQLCRIDHSDIGKIERGEKNITLLTILELARALEVHPKKLMDVEFKLED